MLSFSLPRIVGVKMHTLSNDFWANSLLAPGLPSGFIFDILILFEAASIIIITITPPSRPLFDGAPPGCDFRFAAYSRMQLDLRQITGGFIRCTFATSRLLKCSRCHLIEEAAPL